MGTSEAPAPGKKPRPRSTIQWPYYDLADALEVAHAVYEAGGQLTLDQLARRLQHKSIDSGAFRLRLAGASMFGLLSSGTGRISLTAHANAIESQHPDEVRQALTEAFLAVPLFARIYERYQGRQLPPEAGLKHVIRELGVVGNQIDRAYSVLRRSAEAAGFSASGENYLVAPATRAPVRTPERERPAAPETTLVSSGGGPMPPPPTGIHPALMGLLQVLPASGTPWRRGKRDWLNAFTATINVLYPDGEEDDVREGGG